MLSLRVPARLAKRATEHPWFERFVLSLILGNCITLMLYNPLDKQCETQRCRYLNALETTLQCLFSMEILLRCLAQGLPGYFTQGWNKMDFLVVMLGWMEFLPGDFGALSVFRVARVLRPMRVVHRFPFLRVLVHLLLDIIPMMGSVMIICVFLFAMLATIGVQMWKGVLRGGCYAPWDPSPYLPPAGRGHEFVCSLPDDDGLLSCPPFHSDAKPYTECIRGAPNSFDGVVSFDNIFLSLLAVFQVVTLEASIPCH